MPIGLIMLDLHLPMCHSLKDKRHILSPIFSRLRREFNISVVEYALMDSWQSTQIGIAIISNDAVRIENSLKNISQFIQSNWPDLSISKENLEIIH